jgi:NAD(P)-dependent dehydrogenase (short-subunit alcohol dehydrogenase family)
MTTKDALFVAGGLLVGAAIAAEARRLRQAMDLDGRVALVTGGSRGLGLLIARELGHQGAKVVLLARDEEELQRAERQLRAEGIEASILVSDVTDPAAAEQAVEEVVRRHGAIDVLVNNAGVITVGPLEHATIEDFEKSMAVHFWGPLHTMWAAIPHMRKAGGGRIVNISSIGGKIGVPHLAPYCAGKFALTGLSSAVTPELARDNIVVTTVCPGLMRTGSPFNAWFKGRHRSEFAWFAIADSLPLLSANGRRAAEQIVDAMRHGDAELVITWAARMAVLANAAMPNTLALAMQATNAMLPGPAGPEGDTPRSGWKSLSDWAPSSLIGLSEKAAARNNEVPPDGEAMEPSPAR